MRKSLCRGLVATIAFLPLSGVAGLAQSGSSKPATWSDIPDHVDYLSFRPSQRALTAGYVHPAIKK